MQTLELVLLRANRSFRQAFFMHEVNDNRSVHEGDHGIFLCLEVFKHL